MIKVNVGNNINRKNVFVEEASTLREVLEANGVDYARYPVSLDGATLQPGDLNKSFVEMGFDGTPGKDSCFLLAVAKADNAAKVKIAGGAAVVVSDYTLDEIKKIQKFAPEAMGLYKGEGAHKEEVFHVATGKGNGSINQYGASYGTPPNADGKATITLIMPEGTADPKKWAAEYIGKAIIDLSKVEEGFADALTAAAAQDAQVNECIEVL